MGIQINGQTDTITAIDGGLNVSGADLGSASAGSLNVTGIVTATSFVGNLTGNINATGVSTISTLNVTQSNLTNLNVSGVSTIATLNVTQSNLTRLNVSGVSTFSAGSASDPSISPTGDSNTGIFFPAADTIAFAKGGVEALRIDSNANIGIGTNNPSQKLEVVGGEIKAGRVDSTNEGGQVSFGRATDNATGWYIDVFGNTSTPSLRFVDVSNAAVRATIDGSGDVLIGTTNANAHNSSTVNGIVLRPSLSGGFLGISRADGGPVAINRTGSDGDLVYFNQAGTIEGTISVSGTTISYNGAHLSRWSQLPTDAERTEILRGTVLSNLDEMCEWIDAPKEAVLWQEGEELPEGINVGDIKEPAAEGGLQDNEQLNRMKVSDVEGDPNVAGVFQSWDDDDDTYTDDFYCAMTGDFIIRIAEGTPVHRGQLLMSAGDGTAKPQGDGFVQDKTIAKVTSNHVTCTYDDGSYCVPCVLMAC